MCCLSSKRLLGRTGAVAVAARGGAANTHGGAVLAGAQRPALSLAALVRRPRALAGAAPARIVMLGLRR